MNVYAKWKQTHRHRKQIYDCQKWEQQIRNMGLTNTNYYT